MATVRANTVFIGITTALSNFDYRKDWRSTPDIRLSYENTDGTRVVETLCVDGARTLAKGLVAMADLADPPKPRRKKAA